MSLSFSNLLSLLNLLNLSNLLSYVLQSLNCFVSVTQPLFCSHCKSNTKYQFFLCLCGFSIVSSSFQTVLWKSAYSKAPLQLWKHCTQLGTTEPSTQGNKLGCEGDGKRISLFYLSKCSEKAKSDVLVFFFPVLLMLL